MSSEDISEAPIVETEPRTKRIKRSTEKVRLNNMFPSSLIHLPRKAAASSRAQSRESSVVRSSTPKSQARVSARKARSTASPRPSTATSTEVTVQSPKLLSPLPIIAAVSELPTPETTSPSPLLPSRDPLPTIQARLPEDGPSLVWWIAEHLARAQAGEEDASMKSSTTGDAQGQSLQDDPIHSLESRQEGSKYARSSLRDRKARRRSQNEELDKQSGLQSRVYRLARAKYPELSSAKAKDFINEEFALRRDRRLGQQPNVAARTLPGFKMTSRTYEGARKKARTLDQSEQQAAYLILDFLRATSITEGYAKGSKECPALTAAILRGEIQMPQVAAAIRCLSQRDDLMNSIIAYIDTSESGGPSTTIQTSSPKPSSSSSTRKASTSQRSTSQEPPKSTHDMVSSMKAAMAAMQGIEEITEQPVDAKKARSARKRPTALRDPSKTKAPSKRSDLEILNKGLNTAQIDAFLTMANGGLLPGKDSSSIDDEADKSSDTSTQESIVPNEKSQTSTEVTATEDSPTPSPQQMPPDPVPEPPPELWLGQRDGISNDAAMAKAIDGIIAKLMALRSSSSRPSNAQASQVSGTTTNPQFESTAEADPETTRQNASQIRHELARAGLLVNTMVPIEQGQTMSDFYDYLAKRMQQTEAARSVEAESSQTVVFHAASLENVEEPQHRSGLDAPNADMSQSQSEDASNEASERFQGQD